MGLPHTPRLNTSPNHRFNRRWRFFFGATFMLTVFVGLIMFQSQVAILFWGYDTGFCREYFRSLGFNRRWRFFFGATPSCPAVDELPVMFQSQVAILFWGYHRPNTQRSRCQIVSIAGGDSFLGLLERPCGTAFMLLVSIAGGDSFLGLLHLLSNE